MGKLMSEFNYENDSRQEGKIRELLHAWINAFERKDADAMASFYAWNAVVYDLMPPYKTKGRENIRDGWNTYLTYFPASFKLEYHDVDLHVAGDTAFLFALHRFRTDPSDHFFGQTWVRKTVGYRRIDDQWKIFHEHVSLPVNPMDKQVALIKDPDDLA